uniref:Uncharacterized protein n=1 Tax=viral metagenome TaxID=1070528 RepID=A0A6C0BF12_9ZZZZ
MGSSYSNNSQTSNNDLGKSQIVLDQEIPPYNPFLPPPILPPVKNPPPFIQPVDNIPLSDPF